MDNDLDFKLIKPDGSLSEFVESFWLLHNGSDSDKELIIVPDGRVDLTLSQSATEPFHIILSGLETQPQQAMLKAGTLMFAISFKLPAPEYILESKISALLNHAAYLPVDFWDFSVADLDDFELFCNKASQKVHALLPKERDSRKEKLFELIYASNGSITVKELSDRAYWSSRQITRYFNQEYGLSLKAYCNILRFRASLEHMAAGKFFPGLNFSDQSHFIREVKRFSDVSPKELQRNKNDRFIQFSALSPK